MDTRHWIPAGSVLITGLIWIGLWVVDSREHEFTTRAAVQRNENLAVAVEQYTRRTLQIADLVMRHVAREVSAHGAEQALARLKNDGDFSDSLFEGVGIMDADGRLVATAERGSWPKLKFSDRDYFRAQQDGPANTLFVGRPLRSVLLGRTVIPLSRRLNKPDGSFDGVVMVQIAPSRLTEIYQTTHFVGEDFLSVLGLDGFVRARRTGAGETAGEDLRGANLFKHIGNAPYGSFVGEGFQQGMSRRFVSYRLLKDYNLVVAVGASKASVLSEYSRRHIIRCASGVAFAVFLFLLSWFALVLCKRRDNALELAQRSEKELRHLATHDYLTGLGNRTLMNEKINEALAPSSGQTSGLALLFIDLDNFKYVNDAHGHVVGDALLKSIADVIRNTLPPTGLAFRLGGDEFVILLQGLDDEIREAAEQAKRIIAGLEISILTSPVEITISASIGISVSAHAATLGELLQHADAAMFAAKEGGRRTYSFYSEHMSNRASERRFLEEELRKAIRLGQLDLAYQPKVSLSTGAPVGVEALLRWSHPTLGIVPPGTFIPVAEDSGLILEIGEWVLRKACMQIRAWGNAGESPVPIAVNVSALQFGAPAFVNQVRQAICSADIDPRLIELELTESMIIDRPDAVIEKLVKLKELGVTIALDDFGTGYSNLHYLTKLPMDVLKLDRSFTSELPDNPSAVSVAKAIITLGDSLGLQVVAEGVENVRQADFLRNLGCAIAQGYLFSRPLSAALCATWLKANSEALHASYRQVA